MKLDIPLPVWIVMVLLALCMGVVLGSFAPVPGASASAAAADAVSEAPEPRMTLPAVAEPRVAESLTEEMFEEEDGVGMGSPVPGWERVAQGPGVIAPGTDTLPSAPLTEVALARPNYLTAAAAAPAERGRSVIRITDAREEPSPSRGRTSSPDPCAGVIRDASAPDPTGCRRAAERRLEALCPKEGDRASSGSVICIRGHD